MKRRLLYITSTLIIIFSLYGIYTHVSVSEKHQILHEILRDSGLVGATICVNSVKVEVFEDNLDSFSLFDQPSTYLQKLFQNETLKKELLKGIQLVKNCEDEAGIIYRISLPIVSSNKQIALIKIREDCNCLLGGYGGEFVFKKINGKWTKIKSYNSWIS